RHTEILCRKHKVHYTKAVGCRKLGAVHASRKIHNHARGNPGAFGRGTEFSPEFRSSACLRPRLHHRVLEVTPSICIRKSRRRQELKGRFRRVETQFVRPYLTRIAVRVGKAWTAKWLSYWAATSSMGVSLVTLAPRSGICSMTVPFGHSAEEAKVVFAIFNPPVEIRRS